MLTVITTKEISSLDLIKLAYKEYVKIYLRPEKKISTYYEGRKPVLEGDDLYCSISHSGKYTLCAIASAPVGVDIEEMIDRDFAHMSKRFIGKEVKDREEFYTNWTRAEARFKCEGGDVLSILKENNENIPTFRFINGYSISICSKSKNRPMFIHIF